MVLFIIIVIIIIAIVIDKNSKRADTQNLTKVSLDRMLLPNIDIISPNLNALTRFGMEKKLSIQRFVYSDGNLTITMRNGALVSGRLDQADVRFEEGWITNGYIRVKTFFTHVTLGGSKIKIQHYDEQFTDGQWRAMYKVLVLAGITRNKSTITKYL